ncbi:ABC transporter permease [Mycoplasma sp. SG1]|uniref:ABC transporter permease n=1 Tax=Mycoplasma sp. SG1 TaxID=2810348 RepID=UPI002025949D|nr:ABC transporter permease [Mycoplasma sp. SG1]URM53135.1 ABC transporter permease [Mycoplasma sp. SG1]
MFYSFKNLFSLTFNSKKTYLKLISIILIPLIYGFIYISAFWNPFGNIDKLHFAVVYNVKNDGSKVFVDLIKNSLQEEYKSDTHPKLGNFTLSIDYVNQKDPGKYNYDANKSKYPYALTIGNKFTDNFINYLINYYPDEKKPKLNFYSSYKYNFIIGELGNFFSMTLNQIINKEFGMFFLKIILFLIHDPSLHDQNFLNNFKNAFQSIVSPIFFQKNEPLIDKINSQHSISENKSNINKLIKKVDNSSQDWWKDPGINLNTHDQGANEGINIYGYGLAPFFICIAIWIGAVLHISIYRKLNFTSSRSKEKLSIIVKNIIVKFIFIDIIAILQWLILLSSLLLLGFSVHYFGLFLLYSIISVTIFNFILFVLFELLYSDLARFLALVLLILQLVSSGGIFPVITQSAFIQFFNHLNIFNYFIQGLREFYIAPSFSNIFIDLGIICIFLAIFVVILIAKVFIHWYLHNKKLDTKINKIMLESIE